ncbi:MAG: autotransporter domain-containing protein, partial [bacterium]
GAQGAALDSTAVSENGAPNFNLDLASQESASLKPYLGLTARRTFSFGRWGFDSNLNLGYSWETLSPVAGAVTANGADFTLEDASLQRSQAWVGGGFAAHLAEALSLNGDYSLILPTGNLLEQTLSLGLRYRFL